MSNNFNIAETNAANPRKDLIQKYWWTGDYLANGSATDIGYDGFDIPNEDAHDNPVHGSCAKLRANGNIGDGDARRGCPRIVRLTRFIPSRRPGSG